MSHPGVICAADLSAVRSYAVGAFEKKSTFARVVDLYHVILKQHGTAQWVVPIATMQSIKFARAYRCPVANLYVYISWWWPN